MRRRLLSRALVVLASTMAGLLIGEGLLRAVGFEEELARQRTVFDPRYGTVRADSWIFDFEVAPDAEDVDLRGLRVPRVKPEGEVRVLFIGDSGTEGVLVRLDQTYPLAFQRLLDDERPGHPVRAVNAGVFGMTTIDELHFLRSRLLPLDPDVVVVGVFMSNDINFNLGHTERLETMEPRGSFARSLVDASALARFLYVRALDLNARHHFLVAGELGEAGVVTRDVGLVDERGFHMLSYPAGEVATYFREPSALVEHAFEVLHTVLGQLAELGREHGFEVRVLILPTPSTIAGRLTLLHYPDIHAELRRMGVEAPEAELDLDGPTRRVLSICEALELVCVDPTERMRRRGMEVFFPQDEHPTVTGHLVIARELVERYEDIISETSQAPTPSEGETASP